LFLKGSAMFSFRYARDLGELKELLRTFEANFYKVFTVSVHALEIEKETVQGAIERGESVVRRKQLNPASIHRVDYDKADNLIWRAKVALSEIQNLQAPGSELFEAILQSIVLPKSLQKKVEMASRVYFKNIPQPRLKSRGLSDAFLLEMVDVYRQQYKKFEEHLQLARDAIAQGKAHAEEGDSVTKFKVGKFTVVNTGGFPKDQMDTIAKILEKAIYFATNSGFSEICYGEVFITKNISTSNTGAFYRSTTDEMFIRADAKLGRDILGVVLHELGHRFQRKFLNNDKGVVNLYNTLGTQEGKKTRSLPRPQKGDTMEERGKVYVVDYVLSTGKVYMHLEDNPKAKASIPLEGWLERKGDGAYSFQENPKYIGFVTPYAKSGGPNENFAEMFSFYCLGELPVLQSVVFEELVFGTSKTAAQRLSHRVASKFIARL
jgi:hypothetical protein